MHPGDRVQVYVKSSCVLNSEADIYEANEIIQDIAFRMIASYVSSLDDVPKEVMKEKMESEISSKPVRTTLYLSCKHGGIISYHQYFQKEGEDERRDNRIMEIIRIETELLKTDFNVYPNNDEMAQKFIEMYKNRRNELEESNRPVKKKPWCRIDKEFSFTKNQSLDRKLNTYGRQLLFMYAISLLPKPSYYLHWINRYDMERKYESIREETRTKIFNQHMELDEKLLTLEIKEPPTTDTQADNLLRWLKHEREKLLRKPEDSKSKDNAEKENKKKMQLTSTKTFIKVEIKNLRNPLEILNPYQILTLYINSTILDIEKTKEISDQDGDTSSDSNTSENKLKQLQNTSLGSKNQKRNMKRKNRKKATRRKQKNE
uniref:Uncharacterized protein n=1 Tax=Ditylenchus dipsaci TaxID=166011 RepID=A0A915CNK5_9BILA